jgi:hypothetical protein
MSDEPPYSAPVPRGDEIVNNIIHYFVQKHVDNEGQIAIQEWPVLSA